MTFTNFMQAPWRNSHDTYRESALAITPAPEYASSEVLIASLYRTIGFDGASEGSVPQAGKNLDKKVQKFRDKRQSQPSGAAIDADTWNTVLHGVLESPKLPNQSSKRFLQVSPLVPATALFSGSARLANNSWPAGSLIRRMVWLGSRDDLSARALWGDLFSALSVNEHDDIFASWLEQEAAAWSAPSPAWKLVTVSPKDVATLAGVDFPSVSFPAKQFVKDLRAIVDAKEAMTRRQWTSLLEAVLRLAAVSHVTWLCDLQARLWNSISAALDGHGPRTAEEARWAIYPLDPQYMTYGGKALLGIKDRVSGYLQARLGINAVLWALDHAGAAYEGSLSSSSDVAGFCRHVREHHHALVEAGIVQTVAELREREARVLLCKKGIGSNMLEFARHALGQRQAALPLLRGYDQGYVLKKKGNSPQSPWIVALGPVAVLALVHCALAGMGGPRSVHRLGQHLAIYGVVIDRNEIAANDLGHQLRMLGLVLDSPDAESGMLLLPPFPAVRTVLPKGNK